MRLCTHLALVFSAVFAVSCGSEKELKEYPASNELKAGEQCIIVLPEDHREGSNWVFNEGYDEAVIKRTAEVWHGNEKGIYFYLQALTPGATTISLTKRKYMDTLDYKQFKLIVTAP